MPLTVRAACQAFLDHLQKLIDAGQRRPKTRAFYHWQFQHLIDVTRGKMELSDVRATHLYFAPQTKAFFRCLRALVKFHKLPRIEGLPTPREGQRERVLDARERDWFWGFCGKSLRWITKLIYDTGMRPKEVRELTWGQVREERRIIELRKFKGMDARHDGLRRRGIPMSPMAARLFKFLRRKLNPKFGDRVFSNEKGWPWTDQALRRSVRRVAELAGFDADGGERVVAYTFRHSFATDFLRGLPGGVIFLARILGHSQIETTNRYCHPLDDDTINARDEASTNCQVKAKAKSARERLLAERS